jgi:hypothetical protein
MAPAEIEHKGLKGERIYVVKGTYEGQKGWICGERGYTAKQVYVILERNHERRIEIRKRISRDSIEMAAKQEKRPNNYVEAMLQQHEDINQMLTNLMKEMVKCHITSASSGKVMKVIKKKLLEAEVNQEREANKARWRKVDYVKEDGQISEEDMSDSVD